MVTNKENTPSVSIIMPVYNREKYIKDAITSVVDQIFNDWELIIVDGGSTDGTLDIVKFFMNDKRILLCEQIKDRSPGIIARARNIGISFSKGEYIAFIDSDDIWRKDKLQKEINFLLKNGYDGVFSNIAIINENGQLLRKHSVPLCKRRYSQDELRKIIFTRNIIPTSTVLIKKQCLILAGMFNDATSYGEDYELWLMVFGLKCKIGFLNVSLARWRKHKGNTSGLGLANEYDTEVKITESAVKKFPEYSKYLIKREAFLWSIMARQTRLEEKYFESSRYYFASFFRYPYPIHGCGNRLLRALSMLFLAMGKNIF